MSTSIVASERLLSVRNRLLASPRFQRWAAAFPPTRWLARRRARQLFDLVAGFVYTQTLLSCLRLRLFDALAGPPRTLDHLAAHMGLAREPAERLLASAAALELVQSAGDGRWTLGVMGASLRANPGVAAMVEHHALLYDDLRDPVALLRDPAQSTSLSAFWSYVRDGKVAPEQAGSYSAVMSASNHLIAEQVLAAVSFAGQRCLLDVGGGEGLFIERVGRAAPHLRLLLADLPAVAERARVRLAAAGLRERAEAIGCNFLREPLPIGADVISIVRVLHDHDDASVRRLLAAAFAALSPGGTLIVAEPMSGVRGAEAMADAYFGWYLLAMGQGRPRTPQQIAALAGEAGFSDIRFPRTHLPLQASVMVARRGG
jgi:demethylspheroidene O-methyltransferase